MISWTPSQLKSSASQKIAIGERKDNPQALEDILAKHIHNKELVCRICKELSKRNSKRDSPGGPVVKNPPCNAGDVGSILGQGTKNPHAAGQLSPCATTREPECSTYRAHTLWTLRATTTEPMRHN